MQVPVGGFVYGVCGHEVVSELGVVVFVEPSQGVEEVDHLEFDQVCRVAVEVRFVGRVPTWGPTRERVSPRWVRSRGNPVGREGVDIRHAFTQLRI